MAVFHSLPVPLTDEEQRLKGAQLAGLEKELARIELEKKSVTAGFNSGIKKTKEEISDLSTEVREKRQFRDVPIRTEKNLDRRVMITYREDTGEVTDERPLYAHELQVDIADQTRVTTDGEPEDPTIEQPEPEGESPPTDDEIATSGGTIAERAAAIEKRDSILDSRGVEPPEDVG